MKMKQKCGVRDGRSKEPEYEAWVCMQRRCYDTTHKAYKNYGGRGIRVCDRWLSDYRAFVADVGRKPGKGYSLDRIDNSRDYEPGNCRWATYTEQTRNRRGLIQITLAGKTQCLSAWAEEIGITPDQLKRRLTKMPAEKAIPFSAD